MPKKLWVGVSLCLTVGVLYSAFDFSRSQISTVPPQSRPPTSPSPMESLGFDQKNTGLSNNTSKQVSYLHQQITGDYASEIADADYRDQLISDLDEMNSNIDADKARLDSEAQTVEKTVNDEADALLKEADALLARLQSDGYQVVESRFDITAPVVSPDAKRITDGLNELSTELQQISDRFDNLGQNGVEETQQ